MRKITILFCIIICTLFAITVLIAQPDDIELNNEKAFNGKQRPPVSFPHGLHMEGDLECLDCHHKYVNGENVLEEDSLEEGEAGIKCAECHTKINKYNLMEAFHQQCMGCHGKLQKKGEKTGPRLCGECHPWK